MGSVVERVRTAPPRAAPLPRPALVAVDERTGLRERLPTDAARDALHLVPLLALTAVVHLVGMSGAPRRGEVEGDLVGAAWAALYPATDPTGAVGRAASSVPRLALTAWFGATGALDRAPHAVAAGRELVVVAALATAALVWLLARRLRLPRWAATGAVLLVTFAPTALELQRTLSAAVLATPWLLAAFVLVTVRRRAPAALAGAALCVVVAGLTEPATLLALPGFALHLWRRREPDGRAVADAVGILVLAAGAAAVLAPVTGVPVVRFGGVDPVADPRPVVLAVVALAALAAPALRRLRPLGLSALVLLAAVLVGPADVSGAASVVLVPVAALTVAGVADGWLRYRPTRLGRLRVGRAGGLVFVGVAAVVVGSLAPATLTGLRTLASGDADRPLADATGWVARGVPADATLLTGSAARVELLRQGREAARVPLLRASSVPTDGRTWWLLATPAARDGAAARGVVDDARRRGTVVAAFGSGAERVEVLRVGDAEPAPTPDADDPAGAGAEASLLLQNPAVTVTPQSRAALETGDVDPRLLTLLAVVASRHAITVDAFPESTSGQAADQVRRAVRLSVVDGEPATVASAAAADVVAVVDAQGAAYRAYTVWFPAVGDVPASLVVSVPEEAS
ncbi:hypothetical protein [Phycicoccus sonneratiae]|uniref:4-amino-4-deoxy-L-arabinose transferase-like glycosyltransferase n=1 Tax=Phycicoccus sonneratiae TaxID=2807628 RepID=A0ABS2CFX0_9MICO|nr:hypothetical protein [Phycicoccus sonneraticus]MBM6398774.1 hypothetical protein [Phycicoccus sonneraticus]